MDSGLPFVSRCFCRSIRVKSRWGTPKSVCPNLGNRRRGPSEKGSFEKPLSRDSRDVRDSLVSPKGRRRRRRRRRIRLFSGVSIDLGNSGDRFTEKTPFVMTPCWVPESVERMQAEPVSDSNHIVMSVAISTPIYRRCGVPILVASFFRCLKSQDYIDFDVKSPRLGLWACANLESESKSD